MGDLSKELLKAGLISDKQFRQTRHQERVTKKTVGHEGLEKKERARSDEHVQRRREQQQQDRDRGRQDQQRLDKKALRARLKDLVVGGAVKTGVNGPRRFYFLTREGKIPYLEVNEETVRKIQMGELAIVQIPDVKLERFVLLPRKNIRDVLDIEPDLVRTHPGRKRPDA